MRNPFAIPAKDIPAALPWREVSGGEGYDWYDWRRDMKKKYPVRYFMSRELWPAIVRTWGNTVGKAWYWLRTHTYNRYHVLDMRSPSNGYDWGWCDRDHLMLFACFNLLKEYVEKEYPQVGRAKTAEEFWPEYGWPGGDMERQMVQNYVEVGVEIRRLYVWWTKERPAIIAKDDNFVELDEKDDEMLLRLMKVRRSLWT